MDSVFALFNYLKESTWIESLMYTYGYQDFNPSEPEYHMLGGILLELHESTWSDDLHLYKPDIEDEGLKFLTVFEMRNIYLEQLIVDNTKLTSDVAHRIALSV
jgi:hypothetical protein